MTKEEIDALDKLADEFLSLADLAAGQIAFERAFWTGIARGTRNRIYLRETLWYFNLLERDPRFRESLGGSPAVRARLYKSILAAQRERNGSAARYLGALRQGGVGQARA